MTKPIRGSWFEFQHHNRAEGVYWNPACAGFTAADWGEKVAEMAALGMEYLVLMAVALDHRSFYPSRLLPSWELGCEDPLEALLAAADGHGVKVFIGNGFWGTWDSPDIVAYQDEIGVRKSRLGETAAYYEALRRVHDRVQQAALWADVEVFEFAGHVYKSALLPADFARVEKQLEAVSPFVDVVLIYQYLGLINPAGSRAMAGRADTHRLHADYAAWFAQNPP